MGRLGAHQSRRGVAENTSSMEESNSPKETRPKPDGAFRVMHTADWHLGKLLGEHSREEEHRRFLTFLLEAIREQQVDLLLIAGDVFDSANPPQTAEASYYNFLSSLFRHGGCSVIIVAGNHDSPAHLEAPRQVLRALRAHVVGAFPPSPAEALIPIPDANDPRLVVAAVPFLRDRDLRVGQSGQSAKEIQQALVEGIQRRYAEIVDAAKAWTDQGIPLLATGHLTVAGSKGSDSEREIHVGGLGAVSVDCFPSAISYVALGHLHRPQAAGGADTIRYSGSPIPLSFSEARDRKAIHVLDFAGGQLVEQAELEIPLARRLTQIRTTRQSLEADLGKFEPPTCELTPWVELVVEDPVAGENLHERVQELVQDRGFEVIRVLCQRTAPVPGLTATGAMDIEGAGDLLDQPAAVFTRRLAAEPALTDEERTSLTTVFQELLNLHAEQHDQVEPVAVGLEPPGGAA
jgi:DNA repair protein SbcD/Mre11